jgi:teichuronic acid biosynthesis glycosyltransferase TuaC
MMRILMVSHIYPRRDQPTFCEFIHAQARSLVELGCDVTVLSPSIAAPWFTVWKPRWRRHRYAAAAGRRDDVRVHRPRYLSPPGLRWHFVEGLTMRWGMCREAERLHAAAPFDVIHANRLFPEGYAVLPFGKRWKIPIVAMARGMDVNYIPHWGEVYRQQLRTVIRQADGIASVSMRLLEDIRRLAEPTGRTQVIYNGCDAAGRVSLDKAALRARFGLPQKAVLAMFLGRIERDKGVAELLQSVPRCRHRAPDLHFVLVGRIRDENLVRDAQARGLDDAVSFLGPRKREEVEQLLHACDFFVFPSRREGVPNAVLEAMSAGLPVVASTVGGIPEVVPAEGGFLVELDDAVALETRIVQLARGAEMRKSMGDGAAMFARSRFSWETNARRLLAFYEACQDQDERREAA